jgi:phosphomannomutase
MWKTSWLATGPLKSRLKVVIDCGNGVGALVSKPLFDRLGVDASYLFCESDGNVPEPPSGSHGRRESCTTSFASPRS